MSHSSGIPVGAKLKEAFQSASASDTARLIKVEIVDAELAPVHEAAKSGSWEDDLAMVSPLCEADTPCYILFKKDGGAVWIMFTFVPDTAKVKPKMLYASTRAPLKIQLGASQFEDDLYGTEPADFSKEGYEHFIESKKAEAPLTDSEFVKQQEQESGEIHMGGASTYVHGVAFPVEEGVLEALKNLGSANYVQISIDVTAEKVCLDHAGSVGSVDELKGKIHTEEPRFHIYSWAHQYKGADTTSTVFVFSCPDGSGGTKSAPVRQRMLYSSSKANVQAIVEKAGSTVDGKVECNTADELTEENLMQAVHPPEVEEKKTFARPKRAGAGARRLIRDRK